MTLVWADPTVEHGNFASLPSDTQSVSYGLGIYVYATSLAMSMSQHTFFNLVTFVRMYNVAALTF